ncbi:substrate-binding periplasmic protein [Aquabacterium sp. OR-4]|uniref:substrate-binding periplasmic protein n=1 Tax=Aquabacterium sp. OR-4 TaxID=2978127 RepID=UPI0028C7B08B|nr:ABC transporter substrate-binding protein [Aquabacterium sp. OR-4]MDT7837162.1 ABC transporter substrate-binding protein [Aquabacterium sp. OR-4]
MTQAPPAALRRRQLLAAAAALGATAGSPLTALAQDGPSALTRIRSRGILTVGLYHELPPFHVNGQGIEVEMAHALAKAMDLKASVLPFHAGENMGDDLRNMVWRGHYMGWGPADVLMHVPVDRPLMLANPRVQIFAPYYRERVMIARSLVEVPKFDSLDDIGPQQRIAVHGLSLSGWLLIGADGGKYRERLVTKLKDGCDAAQALQRGEVAAAAGHASELESVLGGDARFSIEPLPIPRGKDGWAVGCAVKKESEDLAQAVQAAMNGLASSGELKRMFNAAKVTWRQP